MYAEARAIDTAGRLDELTYEPVRELESDRAVGLILESLRRRQPCAPPSSAMSAR